MSCADPAIPRVCPVCGDAKTADWGRKGTLRIVRCAQCGMVYACPVPQELASGDFYDRIAADFYLSPEKLAADFAEVRFKRELKLFETHCAAGRVLDVGCSTGAFLHQLRRRGRYQVCGTDVAGPALDHAAQCGLEVIRIAFLAHDFGPRRFDAVTFWAVLEHVIDPGAFLAKASGLIEPGGHCFVLVPNLESLAIRCLGTHYRYVMPDHVNYFSARTLRMLAQSVVGFRVVSARYTHFNPVVLWQDWRTPLDRVPDPDRVRLLGRTTRWKQNPWLIPARWGYRAAEAVLARFGLADNLVLVLQRQDSSSSSRNTPPRHPPWALPHEGTA